MFLTYEKLYGEYETAISLQNEVIKKRREELRNARIKGNFKEVKRLNALLLILYQEKSELEERANGLKEYIMLT